MPSRSTQHGDFVATVRVFIGGDGQWHWQAKSANHQIVAASGEGFLRSSWAVESAVRAFPEARLVVDGRQEDADE